MGDSVELTTIGDALVSAATTDPNGIAVVLPPDRISYAELHREAARIARGLLGIGIGPGDRIGILMPNCLPYIHTFFGAALIGAIIVPINTRYTATELAHLVDHAGLAAIVTTDGAAEGVDFGQIVDDGVALTSAAPARIMIDGPDRPGFISTAALGDTADTVSTDRLEDCRRRVGIADVGLLLYTSGTTSQPKGCMLGHQALVRTAIARINERLDPGEHPAIWTPCPLFHVGALVPLIGAIATRSRFVTTRRFAAGQALELLRAEHISTALPLFAAFTDAIIDHPKFAGTELPALRRILSTGARAAVRRAQAAFAPAELISAYGMTELSGVISMSSRPDSAEDRLSWDGTPLRGIRLETREPGTTRPPGPGRLGEIVAKGYCLFDGYYRDPEATAAAFDAQGWFHTGDLGVIDESGRVAFRGRHKDMLKVGGENVAATEVEDLISGHPAVAQVAVIGVPDRRLDEVVAAYVELSPGRPVEEVELIEFCRARAASFKVPRFIGFINAGEWPMSATKVNKVALRARATDDFRLQLSEKP